MLFQRDFFKKSFIVFFYETDLLTSKVNPLQPDVAFLYSLMFSGGIEKQHRAVMG